VWEYMTENLLNGFVYRWTNQINCKWYIGSHKGTVDDGYRHTSEIMALAEAKHGTENFTREILFEGDYEKDKIREVEAKLLRENNAAHDRMSYNRSNITGPNCVSDETRDKISQNRAGIKTGPLSAEHIAKISASLTGKKRQPFTEEHRTNMSISHKGQVTWMKDKEHTQETKEYWSKIRKGSVPWNKGKTNIYSEETLSLMSDKKRGKPWSASRRQAQEDKKQK